MRSALQIISLHAVKTNRHICHNNLNRKRTFTIREKGNFMIYFYLAAIPTTQLEKRQ